MPALIRITPRIALHEDEVALQFIRASGPGGQNVNKVATAVQLRFNALTSPSLPEDVRQRLLKLAGKRVNEAGELLITAQRHRTQNRNREDALARLAALIRQACIVPKTRKVTMPTRASQERRLDSKRRQSTLKAQRRKDSDWA